MKTAFIAVSLALLLSAALGEIQIDVTTPVQCERKTKAGDKIEVHYRGTLPSGEQFDASYDRGTPFSFKLGVGSVIRGWDQGLLGMCIGEKRTLTIPPEFAYGQRAMGSIPAGSTLIFQTELLGIDGVPKPEKIVAEKAPSAPTEEHAAKVEEAEAATEPFEPSTEHVADANKVADIAGKVADVIKTMLVDTDDSQDHNEL